MSLVTQPPSATIRSMTVRRRAVTLIPPTVFAFGAPPDSAPDALTAEMTAVPAARPSGVRTLKTVSPLAALRASPQVCGTVSWKGRRGARAGASDGRGATRLKETGEPPGAGAVT